MPQIDWTRIGPLPEVSPWRRGKRTLTWRERCTYYATLPKQPIVIIADLVTPILHAEHDATHLDGLLSYAAITDHPVPSKWGDVAIVPLPLDLLWVSPSGLPLWACTPLVSADTAIPSREYWHKRYPTDRAEFGGKESANTRSGRWREYRVPVAAQSVSRLCALAIGNADEVRRLLDAVVTHIGKKGAMGYGRVGRWRVEDAEFDISEIVARRAVPVDSGLRTGGRVTPRRGWTPPYWYAPHWLDCHAP